MKKEEKQNFRTNKKRNSALLYEFLMRHISKCIIEDKKQEAAKCVEICKKFFSEGSPLRNELKLFQSVLASKVSSRESMNKIVEYACKYASLMNGRILDEEKSKLIKEINYNLNKEVYDHKVPNYTNFSSLQMLFNESRNKQKKFSDIAKVQIQDALVSRLMESGKKPLTEVKIDPSYNNTVYRILLNKFHQKYDSKLTENQKKFLIQHTALSISDEKGAMSEFLTKENARILSTLQNIKDPQIKEDKELSQKINECIEKYKKDMIFAPLNEKNLLEFLQYIKLADEVAS